MVRGLLALLGMPCEPSTGVMQDASRMLTSFGPRKRSANLAIQMNTPRTNPDNIPVGIVHALDIQMLLALVELPYMPPLGDLGRERSRVIIERVKRRNAVEEDRQRKGGPVGQEADYHSESRSIVGNEECRETARDEQ